MELTVIARCGTESFFDGNRIFGFKGSFFKRTKRQGVLVSRAAGTKYHQLGGLKQQKCILSRSSGGQNSEIKVLAG